MGRPRKHPRRWYRCIVPFSGADITQSLARGALVPDTDPRVKANPDWFEALDPDIPIPEAVRRQHGPAA